MVSMVSAKVNSNVEHLKGYVRLAPNENSAKITKIIELHANRKIPNFVTAENVVIRLADKRSVTSGRAEDEYNKVVGKYEGATPVTGKLTREAAVKAAKNSKTYTATMILF